MYDTMISTHNTLNRLKELISILICVNKQNLGGSIYMTVLTILHSIGQYGLSVYFISVVMRRSLGPNFLVNAVKIRKPRFRNTSAYQY
jgi:ABC-type transport system involved in cytochrome bd biosynthesis fused ATPase/permease subunit